MKSTIFKTLSLISVAMLVVFLIGIAIVPAISSPPEDPGKGDLNKEVTSLSISKDIDSVSGGAPEISLSKVASESLINMLVGESHDVTFTINIAVLDGNSFSISGNIFVENTGDWPALVTDVSDTVWYKAGGPNWLAAASNITTDVPAVIPTGNHVYSYSGTFTLPVPLADVTSMSNLIEITISNHAPPPGEVHTFHYREDFAKPEAGSSLISLSDIEALVPDTGLDMNVNSVTINGVPAAITGPWMLDLADAPFTVLIDKTLTANAPGDYLLINIAMADGHESEADVNIHVETEVVGEDTGIISGFKYHDLNGNGLLDEGEPPLAGVTIMLDGEGLHLETLTAADGSYNFGNLPAGNYTVSEVAPDGFVATAGISHDVALEANETVNVDFLNVQLGAIMGFKVNDANGNGGIDEGEVGLAGVIIELRDGEGNLLAQAVTAEDGSYAFMGLMPGSYIVDEIVPDGFQATAPVSVNVALAAGMEARVDFFNLALVPVGPGGTPVPPPTVVGPEGEPIPEQAAPQQPAQEGTPQELPRTGFNVTWFVVALSVLTLLGAGLITSGLLKSERE